MLLCSLRENRGHPDTLMMIRRHALLAAVLALAGCSSAPEPIPVTPAGQRSDAAVVRRTIPETPPPSVASAAPPPALSRPSAPAPARPAAPPIAIPGNAIYVCVSEANGVRQQTAIEYSPKVDDLCRKHPEMGPCQYERDVCRKSGGRVYAAGGVEITLQTEAEYDKKVMRVRFKAN